MAVLTCATLVIGACSAGEGGGPAAPPTEGDDAVVDEGMGEDRMQDQDDMGMGDMAAITVAAEAEVETLPPAPLGWRGYRVEPTGGGVATHAWGPAFVYADEARTLEVDGSEATLEPDEAVFVAAGVEHTMADGTFWAFLLTDPDADAAPGLEDATLEMASGPLEDLPDGPAQLRFLLVDLPMQGGRTTVHTHPGPEFIAVADGAIEYETGLEATTELTAGDEAALPADTAVQKRNVRAEPARFWSWFVVDPDEPFATDTTFDRG